jgi:hypothetical protein
MIYKFHEHAMTQIEITRILGKEARIRDHVLSASGIADKPAATWKE